jgi:hypothetical protein
MEVLNEGVVTRKRRWWLKTFAAQKDYSFRAKENPPSLHPAACSMRDGG